MSIIKHIAPISKSRLQPYISLCSYRNNHLSKYELTKLSICTYNAIQHRSCIFFSLIQEIEIAVRNEMSAVIKRDLAPNNDLRKYFCFLAFNQQSKLSKVSKLQLINCLAKLLNKKPNKLKIENTVLQELKNRNINENDIVASLTFGFWVHFLNNDRAKNPYYTDWSNVFNGKLFENRFSSNKEIFNSLRDVLSFRNKLYHQDIVWKGKNIKKIEHSLKNLKRKYNTFTEYLIKISPYRYTLRESAKLQQFQNEFNFDEDLFKSEIANLVKKSFIQPK